jgi:hypothetical protein
MTKAKRAVLAVEQETEAQIVPIAVTMLCSGVSKDVTLGALRGAAEEFLKEYGQARGVRTDAKLLAIRAGMLAEKALATAALDVFRDAA